MAILKTGAFRTVVARTTHQSRWQFSGMKTMPACSISKHHRADQPLRSQTRAGRRDAILLRVQFIDSRVASAWSDYETLSLKTNAIATPTAFDAQEVASTVDLDRTG
jgi:hypothetical protein